MTTRSDSDEYLGEDPLTSEKTSISREDFAEDPLKVVSFPPVENDSVGEMSPNKQMKSSPFASVPEKDGETILSDSVEVSFSESSSLFSKEPEAMDVDCPGVFSVSETASAFLVEDRVAEELQQVKETSAATISEIPTEGDQFGDDVHKMEEVVEADGSVVCISEIQGFVPNVKESLNFEKKGQEDSDVHSLLEAEKRRLLAEIETGTIFRKKDDVNSSKEQQQKVERVSIKDNAFVGRSMKIDVVDDTALLNVVAFCKKGKDHPKRPGTAHNDKDAPRKHKKIGGKQHKVNASNVVEVNASSKLSETSGNQLRIMYSINQMKSMRYAHTAYQKKLWSDMYARLLPKLVTEYEGLVSLKKTSKSNMRESGIGILGTKEGIDDLTLEEEEDEEEEYTEDNDDYNSILKPAFAVDGEPDFESGPPEDGLEYLRRVRWEAKRVPNVKVAKIDGSKYIKKEQSVYMPQIPEIPKCPEHLLPLKEWEDSLLSDFSHLRLALTQNANNCGDEIMSSSSQSTEYLLMGIFSTRLNTVTDESFGEVVSEIQGMDSVTRVLRLKKRIGLVEKESGLQSSDCKWVVALCAAVDSPLDADTCACLRALLRKCASLRALEVEDEQVVIMANMLITIAGRYFGQME